MFTDERYGGYLHIGQTKVPLRPEHDAAAMVPDVLFYDNQQVGPLSTTMQHLAVLYKSYFLITSASSHSGRHVKRFCSWRAPTVGRKPRSWQEQDCGSIPLSSQSPQRISPTTQVCVVYSLLMLLAFLFREMTCFHTFVVDDTW